MAASVEALIAKALKIPEERVTEDLAFRLIPEWDSMGHLEVILVLEQTYGTEIDPDLMVSLDSVSAIRDYVRQQEASSSTAPERNPT